MTALNDVLEAEQKADEMIETAKKEAEATIVSARTEQQNRLETQQTKLAEAGETETKSQQVHVEGLAKKIMSETETQVASTEQKFSGKKGAVKTALLKHFQ